MTESKISTSADPSLLHSLKLQLEGLRRTQHGLILYDQIQRGLKRYVQPDGRIEYVFVTFLHALLGKYAMSDACDPATRVKARLIQQRLTPHLPLEAVSPTPAATVRPAAPPPSAPAASAPSTAAKAPPKPVPVAPARAAIEAAPAPPPPVETLTTPLAERIAVDRKFGELLENERETLKQLDSPLGEFNDLKQILVKGLNELIEERQAMIDKLASAGNYLKAVEGDRERLRQELNHARKHGLADDLTGLPKRDVFVRQLEAEIGRVKRYGFALAMVLIDVDNLESVNQRYGRSAGDAVLRCYAGQILAKFRTYDLVARYGEDEFAVLFPNTQKDGAMQALDKARRAAASTFIQDGGKNIPLPSFSSVLTQYSPGEAASALITRADQTLSQAKLAGYNRMVVALPAG